MSKVSKIVVLGPAYPLRGGIANFNESLCGEFVKQGIDASIISFSLQYPSLLFPGSTQYEQSPPPDAVKNLKIESLVSSINPLSWRKTANRISEIEPQLLIVRFWLPFFAPALGRIIRRVKKKVRGIKVIAITDNIIPHEKRPGDKLLTKYFLNSCDGFVVMSSAVKDELHTFITRPKFKLIPHPVYDIFGPLAEKKAAREHLGLDVDGRYILFFGFIRKYKGLDLLLQAMTHDRIRQLNTRLIVAGEFYEDKKKYADLIDAGSLNDRVILFDHYIPSDEVKYYFASADLVTQPYRSASQSGITQLAYHFERPVLVTRVGGLADVIEEDESGYVTSTEPQEIADKIVNFFQMSREQEMTESIRKHKQKFTWAAMANGIVELSQSIPE